MSSSSESREASFSQFGEDLILWKHFGAKPTGFFLEIGANHPTLLSQTWFLEQKGWKGILVEPVPEKAALLRSKRPNSNVCQVALGSPAQRGTIELHIPQDDVYASVGSADPTAETVRIETVQLRTLDDLIEELQPPAIDFISIDVEGMEIQVLSGFSLKKYQPKIVLLEDHLHSLEVHHHMCSQGYQLVKRTGCNNWYAPAGSRFEQSSALEKFKLWKKINLNVPFRRFKNSLKGKPNP